MKHQIFSKTKLATSLSLILSAVTFTGAHAAEQKTSAEDIEVIAVMGMRSSIKESTRLKRDASGVVDAISAEDIGKFPDTNLAESLQRITGVSIDRSNGEGSRITVRGFGPQYNMITLNGRAMPSSTLPNGGGASDNRAYDFANLSSDAVKSVQVYKTGKASVASGGIGATVNIITAKPFDNPGFIASFGAKALNDTTVRGGVRDYNDEITPELSGLVSWTNEDEIFGASFNASFSERHSSSTGSNVAQWRNGIFDGTVPDMVPGESPGDPTILRNAPGIGEAFVLPSSLNYDLSDLQRERTNAQLTLQFRPADNLTATLDYTYTNLEQVTYGTELSIWMSSYKSDITFTDGLNPSPAIYKEDRRELAPRDIASKQWQQNSKTEDKSLGLNLNWEVNDFLTLRLDAHDSKSSSTPMESFGNRLNVGIGSNILAGQGGLYPSSGLPVMQIQFDDCNAEIGLNCNDSFDVSDLGTSMLQRFYSENYNDITQVRIDGTYELEESSINFGIESRSMDNFTVQSNSTDAMGNWGVENPGEMPAGFLDPIDFNDSLDDYKIQDGWTQAFRGDAAQIGAWGADKYGIPFGRNPDEATNRRIKEDIQAAYFEYKMSDEWEGRTYHLTAGLRYEKTDTTSTANVAFPTAVKWDSNNDFSVVQGLASNAQPYTVDHSYTNLLPSLDFDIEVVDDVIARVSASKTLARPTYGQLNAAANVSGGPAAPTVLGGREGSASFGNPSLEPLDSTNFDISAEWYFAETSYVSIGYFNKKVKNFVGSEPVTDNFFGLRDPSAGPRAEAAISALAAIGEPLNETTLFSMVMATELGEDYFSRTHNGWEAAGDVYANSDDPLMQFLYQSPVNNKDAKIDGFELAVQHFFGETGFGFQANYTIVDGDIGFDLAAAPSVTQFALLGLSDSANLVLMYEKDDLSARLAYNWRDEFLQNAAVDASEPEFVESYAQLDVSIGYQINEKLSVSFAGINLTGEDPRSHGRTSNQFKSGEEWKARYELGVRYNF